MPEPAWAWGRADLSCYNTDKQTRLEQERTEMAAPFPRTTTLGIVTAMPTLGILTSMLSLRHRMFFPTKKQHMPYDTVTRSRHSHTLQIN